jgi:HK97 family phage major capsid protein
MNMSDIEERTSAPTLPHSQAVNRLREITSELERLAELDQLTDDDKVSFDALTVEFRSTNEHRERLERDVKLAMVRSASEGLRGGLRIDSGAFGPGGTSGGGFDRDAILEPDSVEDHRFRNPWNMSEIRDFGRSRDEVGAEYRSRALSAIEKMPGCNDSIRSAATTILEEKVDHPDKLARQILLTSSPAYMRAWSKMARNSGHTMTQDESSALDAVRAMSLTDNAGGYLVPFQLDPTVIITSAGSRNDIRSAARQVVATGDVWQGVSSAAVSFSWDAEAAEVSDDATTFAQPAITLYKGAGFVPISIEALQDEANVTQEVGRLLAFGKDSLEAAAFATGSGSAPQGIVTALAGSASEINAATDDVFAIADVRSIYNALPARHRANASWLANNSIYTLIRAFDTGGGGGFWANLNGDRPDQLLGRNVLEAEGMDGVVTTTGAVNNYLLVFGDFSNYVIADRIGLSVEFIPHLFHTGNNRPSGSRGWYAHFRVGADSVNDDAFRMLDVPSAA